MAAPGATTGNQRHLSARRAGENDFFPSAIQSETAFFHSGDRQKAIVSVQRRLVNKKHGTH